LSVIVSSLSVRICGANRSSRSVSSTVLCTITATAIATSTSVAVALATITITTVAAITSVAAITITSSASVTIPVAAVSVWWRAILKRLVISFDFLKQFVAKFLGLGYAFWARSSNVQIHGLVTLLTRLGFHEA
jgi:hypothetical protein